MRKVGLEPTRLSATDSKSALSTNFITYAKFGGCTWIRTKSDRASGFTVHSRPLRAYTPNNLAEDRRVELLPFHRYPGFQDLSPANLAVSSKFGRSGRI